MLPTAFVDASVSTATIMVMVGLSKASSYVVVTSGLPQMLMELFSSITDSKFVILLLCNQIGETSLSKALKAMLPMLLLSMAVLMLITYIDPLTTFLPSLLK